jgi:aspartate 1-decarboxylase
MLRTVLKSKIHQATVTEANLQYEGSITIDTELLKAADLLPWEKVHVVNLNNGSRIETYCIPGKSGSGVICMNGAAARWAQVGDTIIILSYGHMDDLEARTIKPRIVFVDKSNHIREKKSVSEEEYGVESHYERGI